MDQKEKWATWVKASAATYLATVAAELGVPLIVEGVHDRTEEFMTTWPRIEAHVIGPSFKTRADDAEMLVVITAIVVSQTGQDINPYEHTNISGGLQAALDQAISIWSYGPPPNTPSIVGCLHTSADEDVTNTQVRQNDTDTVVHSIVEATYNGYFNS